MGHSPSTDDILADDTNTFHGLRNPIAVEPVSKLGHALRKLRVFEWLKSWTLMMLDWPKSWAPMVIDWTKSWTDPARIALDPVPFPAPLAAAAGIRTTAPAPLPRGLVLLYSDWNSNSSLEPRSPEARRASRASLGSERGRRLH